ncbi:hypothetical protein ACFSTC_34765 [Nonomuraea ferruginea]
MNRFVAFVLMLPVLAACGQAPAAGCLQHRRRPRRRSVRARGLRHRLRRLSCWSPRARRTRSASRTPCSAAWPRCAASPSSSAPRLPASLGGAVRTVEATTQDLSVASLPRARQVALLKEYRAAAGRIEEGCS